MKIKGGATIWARKTSESDIFYNKPDKWFKIWFYIVNRVNHKDVKQFKRGYGFMKYSWIQESTKATPDQIKKCIRWLKDMGMVSTVRSTRGVTIKVLKYDYFQTLNNYYYDIKSTTDVTREAPEKHQRSTPINKNDNNDNNILYNNILLQLSLVFDYRVSYNKSLYKDIEKLLKRFGDKTKLLEFAKQANSFEEYPYIIESPSALYRKIDKITARLKNKPKSEQEEIEDLNNRLIQKYGRRNT
ncbi:hypothetical protein HOB10_00675 [Candidatus Parcubacteria bacterium]|jgi:hypothetical protein|nr:hypothetical protein [Candidatus Parcubacteria bacterium]